VLCLNVSAGIGIIGAASPMLQETFGGALVGHPELGFADLKKDAVLAAQAAAVAAGFVGLISLFNIFGRIAWASSSDGLGRKATYFIFFVLGAALYVLAMKAAEWKSLPIFVGSICIIASMYGGGFATIPAYLADMFGTQFVGAIHGRLLTAWSTAGIVGPVIVNYLHDKRQAEGIPPDQIYGPIFLILAGLLVGGFIANLLVRPVADRWHMTDAHIAEERAKLRETAPAGSGSYGIGKGGLDAKAVPFWLLVLIPLGWGVWITVQKAFTLFS
jgi:MFS transporter